MFQSGSAVTWDTSGVLSLNGTAVAHSNIIDLISDLTRSRKNFQPQGVDKFISALARINFPLELIGNEHRRAAIQRSKQTGSGLPAPARPDPPRPAAPRHSTPRPSIKTKNVWKTW